MQLKTDILGKFSDMQKHAMRLEQEVRDLRRGFESRKDGSPETQSESISSNMRDEADTIQANIREGISQVCGLDIVCDATSTDWLETDAANAVDHTQTQRRMDEKTQSFQDQQAITLAGVKFQVDAIVLELPSSKEAVTSLKQTAQCFRDVSDLPQRTVVRR